MFQMQLRDRTQNKECNPQILSLMMDIKRIRLDLVKIGIPMQEQQQPQDKMMP